MEVMMTVAIIVILATLSVIGFSKQIEAAAEKQAKVTLKIIWDEERDFYSFRGKYATDTGWKNNQLNIPYKPEDDRYSYKITKPTEGDAKKENLEIKAYRKNKDWGFSINTAGEIIRF